MSMSLYADALASNQPVSNCIKLTSTHVTNDIVVDIFYRGNNSSVFSVSVVLGSSSQAIFLNLAKVHKFSVQDNTGANEVFVEFVRSPGFNEPYIKLAGSDSPQAVNYSPNIFNGGDSAR